jgi:hypothetical protein
MVNGVVASAPQDVQLDDVVARHTYYLYAPRKTAELESGPFNDPERLYTDSLATGSRQ